MECKDLHCFVASIIVHDCGCGSTEAVSGSKCAQLVWPWLWCRLSMFRLSESCCTPMRWMYFFLTHSHLVVQSAVDIARLGANLHYGRIPAALVAAVVSGLLGLLHIRHANRHIAESCVRSVGSLFVNAKADGVGQLNTSCLSSLE